MDEREAKEAGICLALFQKATSLGPIKPEPENFVNLAGEGSKKGKENYETSTEPTTTGLEIRRYSTRAKERADLAEQIEQIKKFEVRSTEKTRRVDPVKQEHGNKSKKVKFLPDAFAPRKIPEEAEYSGKIQRDKILSLVDTKSYHSFATNEFASKLIDLASQNFKCERFRIGQKKLIALNWLTALRIFEYFPNKKQYFEVKRIPQRFIPLKPNLITSFHHVDETFYLAHLSDVESTNNQQPYIEIRNLQGSLLDKPFHYDAYVRDIYSDTDFIYVLLCSNELFIHRKNLFNCIYHRIDLSNEKFILKCWVKSASYNSYTKLPLVTATLDGLLLSQYTALDHDSNKVLFKCDTTHVIISIDQYKDSQFIINSRKLGTGLTYPSKLDLGYLFGPNTEETDWKFIKKTDIEFSYTILQAKANKTSLQLLFVFGYKEKFGVKQFEVGCFNFGTCTQQWVTHIQNLADVNTQILFHTDEFVMITANQQVKHFPIPKTRLRCEECGLDLITQDDKIRHDHGNHDHMFKDVKAAA